MTFRVTIAAYVQRRRQRLDLVEINHDTPRSPSGDIAATSKRISTLQSVQKTVANNRLFTRINLPHKHETNIVKLSRRYNIPKRHFENKLEE